MRKWLRLLPHPFTAADREAGYRYDLSVLQAEFSTTHVLDRPVHGRIFFEQAIRENLDTGRPEDVQLIFQRRIARRTPGCFRTRIATFGFRAALFFTRTYNRLLRPGLATALPDRHAADGPLKRAFDKVQTSLAAWLQQQKLVA